MSDRTKLTIISLTLIGIGLTLSLWGIYRTSGPAPNLPVVITPIPTPILNQQVEGTNSGEIAITESMVLVTKVVDGDTVQIEGGQTVRLIGIDTPETVDPRRPVQCFGVEASNETKRLLQGQRVVLTKDVSEKDRYDRLLRYIYLPISQTEMLFVNKHLVEEGFAKAYTYPPDVKFSEEFVSAQNRAREAGKGLWKEC